MSPAPDKVTNGIPELHREWAKEEIAQWMITCGKRVRLPHFQHDRASLYGFLLDEGGYVHPFFILIRFGEGQRTAILAGEHFSETLDYCSGSDQKGNYLKVEWQAGSIRKYYEGERIELVRDKPEEQLSVDQRDCGFVYTRLVVNPQAIDPQCYPQLLEGLEKAAGI